MYQIPKRNAVRRKAAPFGDHAVERLAWCTGAAQGFIEAAAARGVDAFLSGEVSEPTTLLGLGLYPALLGMGPVDTAAPADDEQPLSPTARRWGWAAAALTALALSLLAVWAMGEKGNGESSEARPDDASETDETQPT